MSENQNRGNIDFVKYDSMATQELEELLRLDAEMPQGQESDTDKILYIMEVLAERKRNSSHAENTALNAYESFKQHYMPEPDPDSIPIKAKGGCPRWVRSLAAAAAVVAILVAGSVTAKAFGFNLWKTVIQWTQETFHFGEWGNSDANNNMQFAALQEALEKGNVPATIVPTLIPDGYQIADITAERSPVKKTYKAIYTNAEHFLKITVRDYLNGDPVYVEQEDGLAAEYEYGGITYYLFENSGQVQAVWLVDSYECCVSGDITMDTLKMMIHSIKKG